MAGIIDRLHILVEENEEDFPIVQQNARDTHKDAHGGASGLLADSLRFRGVAKYVLDRDVGTFRSCLAEAARIQDLLFVRYERKEPISPSFVSMLSYKALLDALAAGEFGLAQSLARHMGGRNEIEKEHDHPFDYTIGYSLKAFVLKDLDEMKRWANEFSSICKKKGNASFEGYAQVFHAILNQDFSKVELGLNALAKAHVKESKAGVFKDSEDEIVCVWGIGVANLARFHGLHVRGVPPLLPDELLAITS